MENAVLMQLMVETTKGTGGATLWRSRTRDGS